MTPNFNEPVSPHFGYWHAILTHASQKYLNLRGWYFFPKSVAPKMGLTKNNCNINKACSNSFISMFQDILFGVK